MDEEAPTDEGTVEAEQADATQPHTADRPPTSEEEAAAERSRQAYGADSETVAEHYEEMSDLGVKAKGEGQVD